MGIKYDKKLRKGFGDFYAFERGDDAAHLRVNFSENKFPYVFSMHAFEGYKGKGIMENLLKYADGFYDDVTGERLRSSSYPDEEVIGYWKRLEKKGLVEKVKDKTQKDFGRWKFK